MLSLKDFIVILNILKLKYIHYGIVYHCENDYNSLKIQKMFNEKQIFVSFRQINTALDYHLTNAKFVFILDSECEDWAQVLSNTTFKIPHTWLVVGTNLANTVNSLSQHPIETDSDVNILVEDQNNYNLHEIFNTGYATKGKVIVNYLGYFDSKLHTTHIPRLGVTMKGVTLKCPIVVLDTVVDETYIHFIDRWRPPTRDPVQKFKFYRVLTYLQTMYGFDYDFVRTNSWGYLRNGSFDGMVGELQRHVGDVGGSAVFFRTDRAEHVQYVVEIFQVRPCFIFRHPKYPGGFYTVFTRPLSTTVWGCLVAVLVLAGTLMTAMLRVSGTFNDTSLSLMFVFISSAVGQQGIPIYSKSSSIKIVIFSTLIFTLTLYQYYNATVVSTLLREPPTTIRSLEDLLHSKMDIGIEDTLYDRDYFRRTTDPVALQLYHTKIVTAKKRNLFTAEAGMRLVKGGGFAFHLESVAGYRLMRTTFAEREICEAQEIQLYPPQPLGVVLKRGSPYREFFAVGYVHNGPAINPGTRMFSLVSCVGDNSGGIGVPPSFSGIRKMHEAGVVSRLNSVWEESKPPCVRTPDTSVIAVPLRDFCMALVVLAMGMLLALVALVGEIVMFRIHGTRNK